MSSLTTTLDTIPESMGIFNKFEDKLPYKPQKKDNTASPSTSIISGPLPRLTGGTGIGGSSMGLNVSEEKHSQSSNNDSRPSTSAGKSTTSALSSSPSNSNFNPQLKSSPTNSTNGNSMGNSYSNTTSKSQPNHSILKSNDSSSTIKSSQKQATSTETNSLGSSTTTNHNGLNSNGVSFADEIHSKIGSNQNSSGRSNSEANNSANITSSRSRGSGDSDSFTSVPSNDGEYFDARNGGSDSGLSRSNTLSSQKSSRGTNSITQTSPHSNSQLNMHSNMKSNSNKNNRQDVKEDYDPYSYSSQQKPSGSSALSSYGKNSNASDRKSIHHPMSNKESDDECGYRSGRDSRGNRSNRGQSPDSDYLSGNNRPRPTSRTASHHGQQAPFRGHDDMPSNTRNHSYRSDGGFSNSSEMRNYYQDGFHAAERDREAIRDDMNRLSLYDNDNAWSDDSEPYSHGSSSRDHDDRSSQTSYGSGRRIEGERGGSDKFSRNGSDTAFTGRTQNKEIPRDYRGSNIPPPLVSRDTYTNNPHYLPPSGRDEAPRSRNIGLSVERKMDVAYEAGYKDAIEKIKRDMMRNLEH